MSGQNDDHRVALHLQPQTPSKPRIIQTPVIGSSCTWKQEQLDRFLVVLTVMEVKAMIPEKFFDFGQVKDYHLRNKTFHMSLTIVRDQLTSVETTRYKSIELSRRKHRNSPAPSLTFGTFSGSTSLTHDVRISPKNATRKGHTVWQND